MPEQIDDRIYLTASEAAEQVGMQSRGKPWHPDTWTSKVSRGKAPQPARRVAGRPLWLEMDVIRFIRDMPGQGYRSDLAGKR